MMPSTSAFSFWLDKDVFTADSPDVIYALRNAMSQVEHFNEGEFFDLEANRHFDVSLELRLYSIITCKTSQSKAWISS